MCKYKSAVVQYHRDTDSITIHHYPDTDSHSEIMARAGIADLTDDLRDCVGRVEKHEVDAPTIIDEDVRPTWLTGGLLTIVDAELTNIIMADKAKADNRRIKQAAKMAAMYPSLTPHVGQRLYAEVSRMGGRFTPLSCVTVYELTPRMTLTYCSEVMSYIGNNRTAALADEYYPHRVFGRPTAAKLAALPAAELAAIFAD